MTSCNNTSNESVIEKIEIKSEFKAKITSIAGDIIDDEAFMQMPIFFNIGTLKVNETQEAETIILADKLSKGKLVNIKPVSLFRFKKDSIVENYIVSVPVDSVLNVYGIYSFHDLSQKQYQTKFLIEDWFRGNCKLGQCSKFEWQSEVQALKLAN